jgi:hypothetical protein
LDPHCVFIGKEIIFVVKVLSGGDPKTRLIRYSNGLLMGQPLDFSPVFSEGFTPVWKNNVDFFQKNV